MKFAISLTLAVLVAGLSGGTATAQMAKQPNGYTWGELSLLPDYCRDTQGVLYGDATNPSPRAAHWLGLMGDSFWHMHHYCRALNLSRKAEDPMLTRHKRAALLDRARGDYEYTLQNSTTGMPLLPEVWLRYGELLLKTEDLIGGKEAFERARAIRPDYWPAYTRWIDVQMTLRQYDQARALAEEGLRQVPGNAELQQRLKDLEQKHSRPESKVRPAAEPTRVGGAGSAPSAR